MKGVKVRSVERQVEAGVVAWLATDIDGSLAWWVTSNSCWLRRKCYKDGIAAIDEKHAI